MLGNLPPEGRGTQSISRLGAVLHDAGTVADGRPACYLSSFVQTSTPAAAISATLGRMRPAPGKKNPCILVQMWIKGLMQEKNVSLPVVL